MRRKHSRNEENKYKNLKKEKSLVCSRNRNKISKTNTLVTKTEVGTR